MKNKSTTDEYGWYIGPGYDKEMHEIQIKKEKAREQAIIEEAEKIKKRLEFKLL